MIKLFLWESHKKMTSTIYSHMQHLPYEEHPMNKKVDVAAKMKPTLLKFCKKHNLDCTKDDDLTAIAIEIYERLPAETINTLRGNGFLSFRSVIQQASDMLTNKMLVNLKTKKEKEALMSNEESILVLLMMIYGEIDHRYLIPLLDPVYALNIFAMLCDFYDHINTKTAEHVDDSFVVEMYMMMRNNVECMQKAILNCNEEVFRKHIPYSWDKYYKSSN